MTILEPMSPERFDEFVAAVTPSHAADNVASGRWPEHEALTLARAELDRLLPQQAATPDHHFFEIKVDPAGLALGFVWLGSLPRGNVRVAYVFQLFVFPEHRRNGFGRAALLQVEKLAEAMGLTGVALMCLEAIRLPKRCTARWATASPASACTSHFLAMLSPNPSIER